MLIYGSTCIALDVMTYSFYAWLGSKTKKFTANAKFVKTSNRASGGLLMLAGILMAGVKRVAH